jgi:hypothetical protein
MSEANALNASFPAEVHLRLDNKWLTDYGNVDNAYADCRDLDGVNTGRQMRPRGIVIGYNSATATATTANVKGVLWAENHIHADTYTLAVGVVHPLSFKFIYANGTNGRDIKIFG